MLVFIMANTWFNKFYIMLFMHCAVNTRFHCGSILTGLTEKSIVSFYALL